MAKSSQQIAVVPYVPGDVTEEKYRLDSHYELAKNRYNTNLVIPNSLSNREKGPPILCSEQLDKKVEETLRNCTKMAAEINYKNRKETKTIFSPILNVISNCSLAKKLQRENLEHNPLPDTITDSIYRKLQKQNELNLHLEDGGHNVASAIGWKGYPGYGSTKCTKLKVFRPKTCTYNLKGNNIINGDRPYTAANSSFENKWRFIRQNKVRPMDLAICWDLTAADPNDEPKPTTHIDGSNGSQALAVFSLVHPPKAECKMHAEKCDDCGPLFDYLLNGNEETDFLIDGSGENSSGRIHTKTEYESMKARTKSAHDLYNINRKRKTEGHYKSTPNLNYCNAEIKSLQCTNHSCKKLGKRLCVACELRNLPGEQKPKSEYKMAFKAGVVVPQKCYNVSKTNRKINVPKQKTPYKLLDYEIHSLASPFSLQNFKREDYPEHWRLATVYQHSYKPVHLRKRNLLQNVYK